MFLIDNPNRRYKQYTYPRRGGGYTAPQIVLHTYEAPYTRSLLAAATWLTTRNTPGSYHALAGARSTKDVLQLAPWSYETWHSVPSNNWSIGISAVAQAHMWNRIPKQARENLVKSMAYAAANAAKWLEKHHGRKVQPRLLTKAQAMRKESGFVYHATMDPNRRTDPGKDFPWTMFINEFNRLMKADHGVSPGTTYTPEEDMPLSKTDIEKIRVAIWGDKHPKMPSTDMRGVIISDYQRNREEHAEHQAVVAGLIGAINAIKGGEPFDEAKLLKGVTDAAHAAAAKGVSDAIKSIDTVVTFDPETEVDNA